MNSQTLIDLLQRHANRVLDLGQDRYSPQPTPLLTDGVEVATGQPVRWEWNSKHRVISNFASQQNLMRLLVGLSALTGNDTYHAAAAAATRYMLAHIHDDAGLLYWGGHIAWDLAHQEHFGHAMLEQRPHHELKRNYPFYEFWWQIDPHATERYIRACWNAHIANWSTLDFNRHGQYDKPPRDDSLWEHTFAHGPVFFVGSGLSFINAGSDLYYSAALLHQFTSKPGPMRWAQHLAQRYIDTADPATGLGGYQFSQLPEDRAQLQFGTEWGSLALEGRILDAGRIKTRFGVVARCNLHLARTLAGPASQFFRQWVSDDLTAFATHLYDPQTNLVQPMWSNGVKLSPADIRRPGYYSPQGLEPRPADATHLWPNAAAWRDLGNPLFWRTTAGILKGLGLGQLPTDPSQPPTLARQTRHRDPLLIFALIELHHASAQPAYLDLAAVIAANIVADRFHHDLFMPSPHHRYARFDQPDPLALLTLAATLDHRADQIPAWCGGIPNFAAEHPTAVGRNPWNRIDETALIYSQINAHAPR